MSLCATIFFTLFVGLQLVAWVFISKYDVEQTEDYMTRSSREVYKISTHSLLPVFSIFENVTLKDLDMIPDIDFTKMNPNDSTHYQWQFI